MPGCARIVYTSLGAGPGRLRAIRWTRAFGGGGVNRRSDRRGRPALAFPSSMDQGSAATVTALPRRRGVTTLPGLSRKMEQRTVCRAHKSGSPHRAGSRRQAQDAVAESAGARVWSERHGCRLGRSSSRKGELLQVAARACATTKAGPPVRFIWRWPIDPQRARLALAAARCARVLWQPHAPVGTATWLNRIV